MSNIFSTYWYFFFGICLYIV